MKPLFRRAGMAPNQGFTMLRTPDYLRRDAEIRVSLFPAHLVLQLLRSSASQLAAKGSKSCFGRWKRTHRFTKANFTFRSPPWIGCQFATSRVFLLFGFTFFCSNARAQEGSAPANRPDAPAPAPAKATPATPEVAPEKSTSTAADADEPKNGLTLGADLYYGASNLPGARRFRDGFWLGAGPIYPSNLYGIYRRENGLSAKIALSVGKIYNGSVEGFDQPVEAYVSKNYRGIDFTAGKFYVPFELLEWEYETEVGVQAARDMGRIGSLTVALTHNRRRNAPNAYARYARTFGIATLGISLGGGRGFSYDSDHNKGAALDLTLEKGRLRLESSALAARQNGAASRFGFIFARLNYQLTPKTELYLARHGWSDRLQQEGDGHFSTLGAVFHLNDKLALESALSRSGEEPRNVRWVQLHYTVEK